MIRWLAKFFKKRVTENRSIIKNLNDDSRKRGGEQEKTNEQWGACEHNIRLISLKNFVYVSQIMFYFRARRYVREFWYSGKIEHAERLIINWKLLSQSRMIYDRKVGVVESRIEHEVIIVRTVLGSMQPRIRLISQCNELHWNNMYRYLSL